LVSEYPIKIRPTRKKGGGGSEKLRGSAAASKIVKPGSLVLGSNVVPDRVVWTQATGKDYDPVLARFYGDAL
jgi:hypothetical protein